jgi:hypothetical protein
MNNAGEFKPEDIMVINAVQAWMVGKANEGQQQLAFRWVVEALCGTYDLSFRPDELGGDRATVFAEGKRFIGQQIVRVSKTIPKGKKA